MNDIASINNYKLNEEDHIITINENKLGYTIYRIPKEDHTLGNLLRNQIIKSNHVEFCAYSVPHPSEPIMNVRI